jgi:preprotein translocase subunit SecG
MSFFIDILTFLLIANCGILALLVLAQPPKKDAGAGLAFGGGTADALFGAGSGNALTKITKWAAVSFIALALILASLAVRVAHGNQSEFEQGVQEQQQQMQAPKMAPAPSGTQQPATAPATSPSTPALPLFSSTNAPTAPPATTTTNKK